MFGCHNCKRKPQKNGIYAESACADCPAAADPALLGGYRDYHDEDPRLLRNRNAFSVETYPDEFTREHFCQDDLINALSRTIRIMLKLKTRSPVACRILEMKIDCPELTYSQLAEKLSCRKQNIQYHLQKILTDCPELGYVLQSNVRKT